MAPPQNFGGDEDNTNGTGDQSIVVPVKHIPVAESFEKKDHSWFATSNIPSDLSVRVEDITFYIHKHPLVSRCGYLGQLELQAKISKQGYELKLENFPGGAETFEYVLKFCYGLQVPLNPKNAAALRCASEFLEMTEELEEGNLISKTESFLSLVVSSSWKDSITVLKSCDTLSPWAENLQIVRRCCDAIAWASQGNSLSIESPSEQSQWLSNVATLRIDHFMRIITAMRLKGLRPELLGSCIMTYAEKWLPGIDEETEGSRKYKHGKNELQWSIQPGRNQERGTRQNQDQRTIIESLISVLPSQKEVLPCKFLLWMLKMAIVYAVSPALISELEKRVGMVLENASVYDLLIPGHTIRDQGKPVKSTEDQTTYNIDAVQRILEYFLMHKQQQQTQNHGKPNISKLLDNYLAEIAGDPNLPVLKFQIIAETLPDNVRTCHDGLYRAIDIYLKTHPSLSDHDKRRLCRVMDYEKLSLDACTHAAQNDRLPLRTVMQVLFTEQVKLRAAMQGKEQAPDGDNSEQENIQSSTKEEIKMLKAELEKMKALMEELQRDYLELQQDCEKLNKKQSILSGWMLGWKKIKKPTLLQGKVDGNENREGKPTANPIGSRLIRRRRQSIS